MTEEERFQALIDDVSGRALETASLVGGVLGVGSGVVTAVQTTFISGDSLGLPPASFAMLAGVFALGLWRLAKRRRHRQWPGVALLFAFFASISVFYVVAELVTPIGAAGYVAGAFVHVYAFGLVLTAMWMQPRLTLFASALVVVQMTFMYLLARPTLQMLARTTPALGELGIDVAWAMKLAIVGGTGVAVAVIVSIARQLMTRAHAEEREKREVSKLFGDFVSADVRDKILRDRGALRSERRTMAVLFSDVRNFTTQSEHTDPAVIVDRLNRYFERMVAAVEREGGVVDKFIGDAVMATFGGVVPLDNPSSSALRAARAMRAALADLNAQWQREGVDGFHGFDNGIGIHFGEVIEGPIGAPRRREYTVIGDVVNTASRVEGLTKEKARPILVTGAVYDALPPDERAALEALGDAHVKGKHDVVRVYGAT